MTDPAAYLEKLRAARQATGDSELRAALDAAIAVLEAAPALGAAGSLAQPVAERTHGVNVNGEAQVHALVAGDVGGDVQTGGQRHEALVQLFFSAAGVATPSQAQREVVTDYLDALARRCDQLRLIGVVDWERKRGKPPRFTLSQVYVALATTDWQHVEDVPAGTQPPAVHETGNPDHVLPQDARRLVQLPQAARAKTRHDAGSNVPAFRVERPLLLTEALCTRRRVVLVGGPGSGKSAFLRFLAVALARASEAAGQPLAIPGWSAGPLFPLLASLSGFEAWAHKQARDLDGPALWQYLLASNEIYGLKGLDLPIQRAFRSGKLLLLLDGLDEVREPASRVQIANAIAALGVETEGLIAVTCRVRSFIGATAAPLAEWGSPHSYCALYPGPDEALRARVVCPQRGVRFPVLR